MTTPAQDDPTARFRALFERAARLPREQLPEPTAFALGTVDASGQPSVRIVLLKDVDSRGFVFYTNFESRKGRELLATRRAAMCFHWQPLEEQVRVEGRADAVSDAEADEYFASRARGSQIGAWASIQSRPMQTPAISTRECWKWSDASREVRCRVRRIGLDSESCPSASSFGGTCRAGCT
jgi:Pyridoxamine-phosphate oxidase